MLAPLFTLVVVRRPEAKKVEYTADTQQLLVAVNRSDRFYDTSRTGLERQCPTSEDRFIEAETLILLSRAALPLTLQR